MRGVSSQEVVWSGWHSSKIDQWGCHLLILLVELVYWVYVSWGDHRRVEYMQGLVALDHVWLHHLFGECCKDNQGWKGHHFWWLKLGQNWIFCMWRGLLGYSQFWWCKGRCPWSIFHSLCRMVWWLNHDNLIFWGWTFVVRWD